MKFSLKFILILLVVSGLVSGWFIVGSSHVADAEDAVFGWAKQIGGTDNDTANSVAVDVDGNVYISGTFKGTVDFDPGPGTANIAAVGTTDSFILKLNSAGEYQWVKQIGGVGATVNAYLKLDNLENLILAGSFSGTVDFDPGVATANLTSAGGTDVFIAKLDSDGNLIWSKKVGGTGNDSSFSHFNLGIDSSDSILVSGYFRNTVDFDPGPGTANLSSVGSDHMFVLKLDTDGDYVWAKAFGDTSDDLAPLLVLDDLDNIYLSTTFNLSGDFDPGPEVVTITAASNSDAFILKLDSNGDYVWAQVIHSTGSGIGSVRSILIDSLDRLLIVGDLSADSVTDFDPSESEANLTPNWFIENASYLARYDGDGNYLDSMLMPGGYSETAWVDEQDNIYFAAIHQVEIDIDPGAGIELVSPIGSFDNFIIKLNPDREFIWGKQFGGTGFDLVRGSMMVHEQSLFALFYTQSSDMDLDPSDNEALFATRGGSDALLLKLSLVDEPSVSTGSATQVTKNSALLMGSVVDTGNLEITDRGFEYGPTDSYGTQVGQAGTFGSGDFSYEVASLSCGTTYHYRAFATNSQGTSYGSDQTFATAGCPRSGSSAGGNSGGGAPPASPPTPSVPSPVPAGAHSVGTNVEIGGTVYRIMPNGYKAAYTSAGAFTSYKFNSWGSVVPANAVDMSLPTSSAFIPPRNGSLINDNGTVYLITDGQRVGFANEQAFLGLGYSFDYVYAGDTSFLSTLAPITNANQQHPNGTLINDNGTIYIMHKGGRAGFPSLAVLDSWGYWLEDVVPANDHDRQSPLVTTVHTRSAGELNF